VSYFLPPSRRINIEASLEGASPVLLCRRSDPSRLNLDATLEFCSSIDSRCCCIIVYLACESLFFLSLLQ